MADLKMVLSAMAEIVNLKTNKNIAIEVFFKYRAKAS